MPDTDSTINDTNATGAAPAGAPADSAAVDATDAETETTEVDTDDASDLDLKLAYNNALGEARRNVELALGLRRTIVDRHPEYRGRSLRRLSDAQADLAVVRTFNTEPVPLITPPAIADEPIAPVSEETAPADGATPPDPILAQTGNGDGE